MSEWYLLVGTGNNEETEGYVGTCCYWEKVEYEGWVDTCWYRANTEG